MTGEDRIGPLGNREVAATCSGTPAFGLGAFPKVPIGIKLRNSKQFLEKQQIAGTLIDTN